MGGGSLKPYFPHWVWREARGQMCVEVIDWEDGARVWWPPQSAWQETGGRFVIYHEGGDGIHDQETQAERRQYKTSRLKF